MAWMPDGSEVSRGFNKLRRLNRQDPKQGLVIRQSSEKYGYYLIDGVRRLMVSSKARTSGSVGRGRLIALRKYLQLNLDEFKRLCDCPMSGPEYHALIRERLGLPGTSTGP